MKTEAIRSGSASLLAFRPSEPRGRRGRERGRGEDPSSEVYSHPSITVALDGIAKELGKAKPQRKLSRAREQSSSSFVSQKDTRGHVNLVSIPISLSLSSSLPRNEAVCLYIIRLCIGYSGHQSVPFIIIIQVNVYTHSTSPILGNQAEPFPQFHWSPTLSLLFTTEQSTPIRHGPWIR